MTDITMPALSPTMEEGALAKWLVKEGDYVEPGDVIAEIETDKATMEVEAVDEGVIEKLVVPAGTDGVRVGAVIAVLLQEGETAWDAQPLAKPSPTKPAASDPAPAPASGAAPLVSETGDRIFATPLARRLAAERGLELGAITGSGPRGRITKADILSAPEPSSASRPAAPTTSQAQLASPPDANDVKAIYEGRDYEEIALDGMRRTIAARLTEAKQTIPHFYLRRDIRLDALLSFRSELNNSLSEKGVKISVNDFVIKACALALREVPACNAAWAGDRILKFRAADVAVAVAIEGGLFTPVIRDAEEKTLSTISDEMKYLANRARDRKLNPDEYQGGAFAISNLGMMGIENFDAVINPPHGAILAVGAAVRKPVVEEDQIKAATVMSVTLSVDHRVIDGALGAELLAAIKGYLEAPLTMLV